MIYLRHLACWETLGWELRARARHVTQADGDFSKVLSAFRRTQVVKPPNFFGSQNVVDRWVDNSSVRNHGILPSWKVIHQHFLDQKKDNPKNINFDQGFLHNNGKSLPLIPSGPYCWSHVREWLEAQQFFKISPWFVDSLDFWTIKALLVSCYSSRYHSSWIHSWKSFAFRGYSCVGFVEGDFFQIVVSHDLGEYFFNFPSIESSRISKLFSILWTFVISDSSLSTASYVLLVWGVNLMCWNLWKCLSWWFFWGFTGLDAP